MDLRTVTKDDKTCPQRRLWRWLRQKRRSRGKVNQLVCAWAVDWDEFVAYAIGEDDDYFTPSPRADSFFHEWAEGIVPPRYKRASWAVKRGCAVLWALRHIRKEADITTPEMGVRWNKVLLPFITHSEEALAESLLKVLGSQEALEQKLVQIARWAWVA